MEKKIKIPLETVTRKPKAPELSGVSEVMLYMQTMQSRFLTTLQYATNENRFLFAGARRKKDADPLRIGWENVKDGKSETSGVISIFTASRLCTLASFALYDGMKDMIGENLKMSVMHTNVFFNKLQETGLTAHEVYGNHVIVQITDIASQSTYFIDPTYGQIDQEWAGKFLVIPDSQLGKYYATHKPGYLNRFSGVKIPLKQSELRDVSHEREKQLPYLLNYFGITDLNYRSLVQVVSPKKIAHI